jgi:hypothetical protein
MLIKLPRGSRWYTFVFVIMFSTVSTMSATAAWAQTEDISNASKGLREGLNKAWQILFLGASGDGSGSIFQVINSFMLFFAFTIFVYRAILLYRESVKEGSEAFIQSLVVDKLIPVGIVLILLSSNGLLGGYLVLASRNAVYNINQQTGQKTETIAQTTKLMGDYEGQEKALERLREKQADCAALAPEKDGVANPAVAQCIEDLKKQADTEIASGAITSKSTIKKIKKAKDAANNPLGALAASITIDPGELLTSALNTLIKTWIITFGILYLVIVEGAMLVMGVIAPMAIATSLLSLKPLIEWLTKFAGLGIMRITYTLAVAIYQIIDSVAGKDLGGNLFTLALGVGAPFLSLLAASQSGGIVGAAVESAVLGAAGRMAQFAGGKVGTAVGKPVRSVGQGVGRIAGKGAGKAFNKFAPAPVKAAVKAVSNAAAKVRK